MSLRVVLRPATAAEIRDLEARERTHRAALRQAGLSSRVVVDEGGIFAAVLVEHEASGRRGFLDEEGQVLWLDEARGIGALAPAVAGGPRLESGTEGRGARRRRRRPSRR